MPSAKCSPGVTIFAPKFAFNDAGNEFYYGANLFPLSQDIFSFSEVCIYTQYFLNIVFLKDVNTKENICSPLHFTLLACKKVLINIKSRSILEISIVYPTVQQIFQYLFLQIFSSVCLSIYLMHFDQSLSQVGFPKKLILRQEFECQQLIWEEEIPGSMNKE